MIGKKLMRLLYFSVFFLGNTLLWAQPGGQNGTGDLEGNDVPAASIDMYVSFSVLGVFLLVFFLFRKNDKKLDENFNN